MAQTTKSGIRRRGESAPAAGPNAASLGRRRATQPDVTAVAAYLHDNLGQVLTALVAGTNDAGEVARWARGETRPSEARSRRLRTAYDVVQLLRQVESPQSVRAWFTGMNPELDDRAPALVIREEPARVMAAARSHRAHG